MYFVVSTIANPVIQMHPFFRFSHWARLCALSDLSTSCVADFLSPDELPQQGNGKRVFPVAVLVDQPRSTERAEHLIDMAGPEGIFQNLF